MESIRILDSHTGGEPTRVVLEGAPVLAGATLAERCADFSRRHDAWRAAIVNEPRGSEVLVGALLVEPRAASCAAGVIFFNNVGVLGMCGHGAIGVVATLAHLGRLSPGDCRLDTPVGPIAARLHEDGRVSIRNVPAFRKAAGVVLDVEGVGKMRGDVAWGGNWFFLVAENSEPIALANVARLTDLATRIRRAANVQGFPEIDHVELFGPPRDAANSSRNFVLCPGGAFDRSPCGTGTSAKLACLFADGKLRAGEVWRQESVLGSVFEGVVEMCGNELIPTITARAWITGEATLLLDESDPFCWGIRRDA